MLVLSRRREETIVIGNDIEIVVLHIGQDGVKLGVRAPEAITIYRGELHEQVAAENRAAAATKAPGQDVVQALRQKTDLAAKVKARS